MRKTAQTAKLFTDHFEYHFKQQFQGINFDNASVLEIGCGKGLVSTKIALSTKAKRIVALDESAGKGSRKGVLDDLRRNIQKLNIRNITVAEEDFWQTNFNAFNIIIANNSLHHLVSNGKYYFKSLAIHNSYKKMFSRINNMLENHGLFVIKDIDPLILFRIINPRYFRFMDWEDHPPYKAWLDMIDNNNFSVINRNAVVPYALRKFASILRYRTFSCFFRGGIIFVLKKWTKLHA